MVRVVERVEDLRLHRVKVRKAVEPVEPLVLQRTEWQRLQVKQRCVRRMQLR